MKRLLLALFALPLFAQGPPVLPDCQIQIVAATATGASAAFDNRGLNCTTWTLTVQFQGFSAASVELDSAPDNAGAAGTFAVFAGTVVTGVNPIVAFTQKAGSASFNGYFPWLRVNITSLTGSGTINLTAAGFRPTPVSTSTGSGTTNITQVGGNNVFACNSQALFNFSVSGNAQIIPASGSNRTIICHYDVAFASSVDFKLTTGTGANCVTGNADLTGLKKSILTDAEDYGPFSPLIGPASQAVCGNSSGAVAGGLTIVFTQVP